MGDVWRLGDMLREFRGDAHIAAWTSAGFDATEIGLLTELYWGLPMRTYVRTRAWIDDDLDAAEARLATAACSTTAASPRGPGPREAVEVATDVQCQPIIDALGDDLDELVAILEPWGAADPRRRRLPARGPPHHGRRRRSLTTHHCGLGSSWGRRRRIGRVRPGRPARCPRRGGRGRGPCSDPGTRR